MAEPEIVTLLTEDGVIAPSAIVKAGVVPPDELPDTPFAVATDTAVTVPTNGTTTVTPICSVEELSGSIIGQNMNVMNKSVDDILDNINSFLSDIQSELSEISGAINNVGSIIGGISGSITSALSFTNIILNIFPSDLKPNCAVSDQYSIATGGGATEQPQLPRPAEVDEAAKNPTLSTATAAVPFKEPTKSTPDVDFSDKASTAAERTQVGTNQTPGFTRIGG